MPFQSYVFVATSPTTFVLYIVYDQIRVDPSVHPEVDNQALHVYNDCNVFLLLLLLFLSL